MSRTPYQKNLGTHSSWASPSWMQFRFGSVLPCLSESVTEMLSALERPCQSRFESVTGSASRYPTVFSFERKSVSQRPSA